MTIQSRGTRTSRKCSFDSFSAGRRLQCLGIIVIPLQAQNYKGELLSRPGIVKISFMDMSCNEESLIEDRNLVEQGNGSDLQRPD
jgi:hypothetical protein